MPMFFLSLIVIFTISEAHRMQANQVSEHFDFMIETTFMKIACWGALGFMPCGLIGTCPSVPHAYTYIMLIKQKLFLFLASLQ